MSKASEISRNVWLGPTPDSSLCNSETEESDFDILIEASDVAPPPEIATLHRVAELSKSAPQHLEFPSSGSIIPPATSSSEPDPLTETCRWIYSIANSGSDTDSCEDDADADGDIPLKDLGTRPRKILLHCADGYTETTLLGVAYYMFAEGVPLHDAWLRLHCQKQRNFFAYPSDIALLSTLQSRLLASSPRFRITKSKVALKEPAWLSRIDGSLPSRILPNMYLGNLGHANNPDLLRALGIGRVLSVGEPVTWNKTQLEKWGNDNLLFIDRVQDNGVDPLTDQFEKCLDFIGKSICGFDVKGNEEAKPMAYRERQARRKSNISPLPRWRFSLRNNMHCRSHVVAPTFLSTRLVWDPLLLSLNLLSLISISAATSVLAA